MSSVPKSLENRCALITGASRGLGAEIAKRYLEAGANVMICARGAGELHESLLELRGFAPAGQCVVSQVADISSPSDVAALVDRSIVELGRLDILVNNAGVAGPMGTIDAVEWHQWLRAIEINLLGAVLLCRAALPHLERNGRGKIVQLSGGGATHPLAGASAYAVSKTAVVRFVETLAEEVRGNGIDVNALAPGAMNTRMLDAFIAAGPEIIGASLHERSVRCRREGGVPLARAADLAVFLGSSASDGITGKLISAAWDDWRAMPSRRDELRRSDIYTLRRIVPGDRRLDWAEPE